MVRVVYFRPRAPGVTELRYQIGGIYITAVGTGVRGEAVGGAGGWRNDRIASAGNRAAVSVAAVHALVAVRTVVIVFDFAGVAVVQLAARNILHRSFFAAGALVPLRGVRKAGGGSCFFHVDREFVAERRAVRIGIVALRRAVGAFIIVYGGVSAVRRGFQIGICGGLRRIIVSRSRDRFVFCALAYGAGVSDHARGGTTGRGRHRAAVPRVILLLFMRGVIRTHALMLRIVQHRPAAVVVGGGIHCDRLGILIGALTAGISAHARGGTGRCGGHGGRKAVRLRLDVTTRTGALVRTGGAAYVVAPAGETVRRCSIVCSNRAC